MHEVHYAIVVILSMGVGLFSPPFGVGYYSACAISKVNPDAGIRPIIGYMDAAENLFHDRYAFFWLGLNISSMRSVTT